MFEYDPAKSSANLTKHGINFDQAQALWEDPLRVVQSTHPGRGGEIRQLVVGMTDGKLWSAVFAERKGNIRIISVRRARDREMEAYRG